MSDIESKKLTIECVTAEIVYGASCNPYDDCNPDSSSCSPDFSSPDCYPD